DFRVFRLALRIIREYDKDAQKRELGKTSANNVLCRSAQGAHTGAPLQLPKIIRSYRNASRVVIGALASEITVLRECLLVCIFRAAAVNNSSVVSPSSG